MVGKQIVFETDDTNRIIDIAEQTSNMSGTKLVCMNIMVMSRLYLQNLVLDAIAHGYKDFYRDSMMSNVTTANFYVYEHKGYHASITSPAEFFKCNMELLEKNVRDDLLNNDNRPILTKVRNSPPTKYVNGAKVKNSLLADGCVIEGTVENSIIFRGVHVGKGTVVRNSILMQDTFVGKDVELNCVITDKNVMIGDGCDLSGHETRPFYIEKGARI